MIKIKKAIKKAYSKTLIAFWNGERNLFNLYDIAESERGASMAGMGILAGLISVVVVLIVLFYAIPIIWPVAVTASENMTSMSGTDEGTTIMKAFVPIILLVIGLGLAVALIVYAIRKFGIMGRIGL